MQPIHQGESAPRAEMRGRELVTAARANFRYRLPGAAMLLVALCVVLAIESAFIPAPWLAVLAVMQLTPSLASLTLNIVRVARQPSDHALATIYLPWSNVIAVCIAGANGASALIVYSFATPEYQTLYLVILAGISGLQAIMTAVVRIAPAAVLLFTLTPQGVWFLFNDSPNAMIMTAVTVVWLFVMLGIVRETRKLIHENVTVSYQAQQLAARLAKKVDELEEARKIAEDLHRSRTKFFAAASHDLRQPLHALGMLTELLHDADAPAVRRGLTERINAGLRSADGLLGEVLELARLDANTITPRVQPVSLAALLGDIHATWKTKSEEAGMPIQIQAIDAWVLTDRGLMFRILNNLVGNAVRHSATATRIVVRADKRGDQARVSVVDNGMGVPVGEQQRIFDEFVQGERAASDPRGGMGLGLAIVQRTTALLDHRVGLSSEPGHGAAFWVEADLCAPAQTHYPSSAEWVPGRVMVIEDDEASAGVVSELLGMWGCTVVVASTVADALASLAREGTPDIIIADMRLENGESGVKAVRAMEAEAQRRLAVVYVTGETPEVIGKEVGDPDATILFKPVAPSKLRSAISYARLGGV